MGYPQLADRYQPGTQRPLVELAGPASSHVIGKLVSRVVTDVFAFPNSELLSIMGVRETSVTDMNRGKNDHAEWLSKFVERHGGVSGTVHLLENEMLTLSAAVNIPPHVRELVARIPRGKGMAGLAWERNEPVVTCNLKEDNSGNVRPGAKAVNAGSGVALPVRNAANGIRAIVGIAYKDPRELSQAEIDILMSEAAALP